MTGRPRDAGALPVVEPEELDPADAGTDDGGSGPAVAGVVLAAGTASRFGGGNKLLATLGGEPLVRLATGTLLEAGLDPVLVVVGHEADRVAAAVNDLDAEVVENPDYARGQATSVRAAVAALRGRDVDAVVFALGDMPAVEPGSVRRLVAAFAAGAGDALAAAYAGRRGNPVLFGAGHLDALAAVTGDSGAREVLLGGDRAALVETGDPGVLRDVDRPGDLDALR